MIIYIHDEVADIDDCQRLSHVMGWTVVVRVASTSVLFFLRTKVIMAGHRWIIAIYAIIWICDVGAAAIDPFSYASGHLGPTKKCINTNVKSRIPYKFLSNAILVCDESDRTRPKTMLLDASEGRFA